MSPDFSKGLVPVLLRVNPAGPACHTGAESCFFNALA